MFERSNSWRSLLLVSAVLAVGCGDDKNAMTESGTETTTSTTETTGTTTDTAPTTGTTTTDGTATEGMTTTAPTTTDTGTTTTGTTDMTGTTTMGMGGGECEPTLQDCAEGEKCIAYDSPEGPDAYWDANQCVPEPPNAGQKGDTCNIDMGESVFSGMDNCAEGTMCFNFDFGTGQDGICTAFCGEGDSCGANEICLPNANDGVLPLCLNTCDPLVQDCPNMHACYGDPSLPEFFCAKPDPGNETGMDGSPCQFTNACLAGFACMDGTLLEGCNGADYCCTPYCTVGDDTPCAPTEDCVPFYAMDPPPGLENVGLCVIPG